MRRPVPAGPVSMTLPAGEAAVGPWRAVRTEELARLMFRAGGVASGRPLVMAVDGRGGSGKSTLSEYLHQAVARSAIVHTDDLAWHEPLFAWGHLLTQVLEPLHRSEPVRFRPPGLDRARARRGDRDSGRP